MLKQNKKKFNSAYCDSKKIITNLEKNLGMNITEIKKLVNNAEVVLTEKEIKAFLEQKLIEENPKLKQWLDERDNKKEYLNKQLTMDEQFEENNQYFSNMFALNKYKFEPYTLEYFNKYISIVRKKILILLDIIEKIGNKNTSSIADIILDLDIVLDVNGNILIEDIDRLIKPTVVNIHILQEQLSKANDLSTYLTFKMSKLSVYRNGFSESELYPSTSLQDKGSFSFHPDEYVSLSIRQQEYCNQLLVKSRRKCTKLIFK